MLFIDSEITVTVSKEKKDIIKTEPGILGSAVYVTYHGMNDWGWNGHNF